MFMYIYVSFFVCLWMCVYVCISVCVCVYVWQLHYHSFSKRCLLCTLPNRRQISPDYDSNFLTTGLRPYCTPVKLIVCYFFSIKKRNKILVCLCLCLLEVKSSVREVGIARKFNMIINNFLFLPPLHHLRQ